MAVKIGVLTASIWKINAINFHMIEYYRYTQKGDSRVPYLIKGLVLPNLELKVKELFITVKKMRTLKGGI